MDPPTDVRLSVRQCAVVLEFAPPDPLSDAITQWVVQDLLAGAVVARVDVDTHTVVLQPCRGTSVAYTVYGTGADPETDTPVQTRRSDPAVATVSCVPCAASPSACATVHHAARG